MKILVAYDDSECAKAAIEDLQRAGLPQDATAVVVSVVDTLLPSAALALDSTAAVGTSHRVAATLAQARAATKQSTEDANDLAHEGSKRVRRCFPGWQVFAEPIVGTATRAILQKADNWPAHLIVLGSHGRSALGRLIVGSVCMQVASECSRSVRVARHVITRGNAPVRVIVGVDGSGGAAAAIRAVLSRRWPAGTEVRVVAADDPVRPTGTVKLVPTATEWINESNDIQVADMGGMVHHAAEMFLEGGFDVSMRVAKGIPRDVLNEEALGWGADCIFVGARGTTTDGTHGGVGLGDVATALVSSAPCSVEITRALSGDPQNRLRIHRRLTAEGRREGKGTPM
jgi:nucleotide-binding universal stress UspA family protein